MRRDLVNYETIGDYEGNKNLCLEIILILHKCRLKNNCTGYGLQYAAAYTRARS
jgi:ribosomal protein S17E